MKHYEKIKTAAAGTFILIAAALWAGAKPEKTGIHVSGTGIIGIKPDTAAVRLAVITEDNEAAPAAEKNAELTDSVIKAVQKAGVREEDTATRDYSVYRQSRYNSQTGTTEYGPYRVSNNLTVTVRSLADTGKIIDAALQAGANQLSDISFYARDTAAAYEEARTQAFLQAYKAAEILSKAAGRTLGKAVFIEEYQNGAAYRNDMTYNTEAQMMKAAAVSTPITPGNTEISVTVQVVFELK